MVKRWHEPISPPKRHCRSRSATETNARTGSPASDPHRQKNSRASASSGTKVSGKESGSLMCPLSPLVRYFLPHSDARRTEKAPPGGFGFFLRYVIFERRSGILFRLRRRLTTTLKDARPGERRSFGGT